MKTSNNPTLTPKLFDFRSGILIAIASALLTCGYEFVRSPSNTLFKLSYGVENLPYAMMVMPLGVIFTLYIYNLLLNKYGPGKTLFITAVFSSFFLAFCYLLFKWEWKPASVILYIYREAYIVLIIEQYWSFINSVYKRSEATKFNGFLLAISSLGAITGGILVHKFSEITGTAGLLLFASMFTLVSSLFSLWAYKIDGHKVKVDQPDQKADAPKTNPKSGKKTMGFELVFTTPVLLIVFTMIILTQIVSTALGLNFQNILQTTIPSPDEQTAYSGLFFAKINSGALLCQLIITPLVLRFFRSSTVHILIALLNLSACALSLYNPSLAFAGSAYLVFKSLDYSLFRAAKELLYIPLSFDMRFRSKEIIDVFAYRFSKGGTSLVVIILERAGAILAPIYGAIALLAASFWFAVTLLLRRHNNRYIKSNVQLKQEHE